MQPLASLKALADPIYEAFYGLRDQPFAITTDPKFFYLSSSHQQAFSELLNGLKRREGLVQVTGETGTGKTTLCRAVLEALGPKAISAMILNPYMSGPEVLRLTLREFGLISHEDLRRGSAAHADVSQLIDTLEGFLLSLVPFGTHAIIVLDEAQSLSPQVLDQIRLLTALEHEGQRLVQIVLCGQPGLLNTLKHESLYALNERITRRIALQPLAGPQDVEAYIKHRLNVAGAAATVKFDAPALRVVSELSHGLPRRVNVLCDRALQEGRIEGVNVITGDLVKRAARGLAGALDPTPAAPAEPVVLSTEQTLGSFTFATESASARRRRLAKWAAVVVAAGLAVGSLAGLSVQHFAAADAVLPHAPGRPAREVGAPAKALAVPSPEELDVLMGVQPAPAPRRPSLQFPDGIRFN